jgi:hypothetical protein
MQRAPRNRRPLHFVGSERAGDVEAITKDDRKRRGLFSRLPPCRTTVRAVVRHSKRLSCVAPCIRPPLLPNRAALGVGFAAALLAVATPARAQMATASCDGLVTPRLPVLYLAGPSTTEGSGVLPLVEIVAGAVAGLASAVYMPTPPCTAIQSLVASTPGDTAALYLNPAGGTTACAADATPPDVAVSDIYPVTCTQNLGIAPLTSAELDFIGPIQTSAIIVPSSSSEKVISADAAYVVFGFGAANYVVAPWSDPASIFVPNTLSGPLNLIGATVALSPGKWVGAKTSTLASTSALASALKADAMPSAAIGILPGSVSSQTSGIKVLAYQHSSQECGFLPDSDSIHFDKINVRQGRYALWGPTHFIVHVDSAGTVLDRAGQPSAILRTVLDALAANGPSEPAPGVAGDSGVYAQGDASAPVPVIDGEAFTQAVASASFIPWCAMQVVRAKDGDPEASYQPSAPCSCSFESAVGATTSFCATCGTDADCTGIARKCRYGYCEVQ